MRIDGNFGEAVLIYSKQCDESEDLRIDCAVAEVISNQSHERPHLEVMLFNEAVKLREDHDFAPGKALSVVFALRMCANNPDDPI